MHDIMPKSGILVRATLLSRIRSQGARCSSGCPGLLPMCKTDEDVTVEAVFTRTIAYSWRPLHQHRGCPVNLKTPKVLACFNGGDVMLGTLCHGCCRRIPRCSPKQVCPPHKPWPIHRDCALVRDISLSSGDARISLTREASASSASW